MIDSPDRFRWLVALALLVAAAFALSLGPARMDDRPLALGFAAASVAETTQGTLHGSDTVSIGAIDIEPPADPALPGAVAAPYRRLAAAVTIYPDLAGIAPRLAGSGSPLRPPRAA